MPDIRTAILYITQRCNQSCVFCLEAGGILGVVGALGCVALLVVMFVKKPLVLKFAIGTLVLCAVAAIVYPGIETGPMDGMAPRPQMLLALGLGAVGAVGAWLASRQAQRVV